MAKRKTLPFQIMIGEKYDPAMTIEDQSEADEYFKLLVDHSMAHGHNREQAERIERLNLGYYAGYCSHETRLRVERLFQCSHPVFGAATQPMSAEEAFVAGAQTAAKAIHG